MTDSPDVQQARTEAEQSKHRLMALVQELQARLAPGTLAKDAWEGAKSKGADLAEEAVDAVRKRPIAATGAVAAVALFLARAPLMDLAGKLWNGKADKPKRKTSKTKGAPTEGARETLEA